MKRFAANRIYLSEDVCFTNAVMEIDDDGTLLRVLPLEDCHEIHSTPFYNGILVPFAPEMCDAFPVLQESVSVGDKICRLTLLEGEELFSKCVVRNMRELSVV